MSMWVRADWLEGGIEEEGVIPEVWAEDKNVRWPNGVNVQRARLEQRVPSAKWLTFPLVTAMICGNITFKCCCVLSRSNGNANYSSTGIKKQ